MHLRWLIFSKNQEFQIFCRLGRKLGLEDEKSWNSEFGGRKIQEFLNLGGIFLSFPEKNGIPEFAK